MLQVSHYSKKKEKKICRSKLAMQDLLYLFSFFYHRIKKVEIHAWFEARTRTTFISTYYKGCLARTVYATVIKRNRCIIYLSHAAFHENITQGYCYIMCQ